MGKYLKSYSYLTINRSRIEYLNIVRYFRSGSNIPAPYSFYRSWSLPIAKFLFVGLGLSPTPKQVPNVRFISVYIAFLALILVHLNQLPCTFFCSFKPRTIYLINIQNCYDNNLLARCLMLIAITSFLGVIFIV